MKNDEMGKRISELAQKRNMTQKELAEKAGVTEVSMSRYVNGLRKPQGLHLINIARALGTSPEYLQGRDDIGDSEVAYYQMQAVIARNAKNWSADQKSALVKAIFESA